MSSSQQRVLISISNLYKFLSIQYYWQILHKFSDIRKVLQIILWLILSQDVHIQKVLMYSKLIIILFSLSGGMVHQLYFVFTCQAQTQVQVQSATYTFNLINNVLIGCCALMHSTCAEHRQPIRRLEKSTCPLQTRRFIFLKQERVKSFEKFNQVFHHMPFRFEFHQSLSKFKPKDKFEVIPGYRKLRLKLTISGRSFIDFEYKNTHRIKL